MRGKKEVDVRCSIFGATQFSPANTGVFWVRDVVLICRRGTIVALRVAGGKKKCLHAAVHEDYRFLHGFVKNSFSGRAKTGGNPAIPEIGAGRYR